MTTTNDSQAPTITIKAKPEYGSSTWLVTVECCPQVDEYDLGVAAKTIQDYVDDYWKENREAFFDDYPGMRGALDTTNDFKLELSDAEAQEIATAFIKYLEWSKAAIKEKLQVAFKDTAEWDWRNTELEFCEQSFDVDARP